MRFLHTVVREQIRLGWLPVIAHLVGTGRCELSKLQDALVPLAKVFPRWAHDAGLHEGPLGNVQQSRVDRLARMGITYGIYDEEIAALSDLGHVLRCVAPWSPDRNDSSPLQWRGGKRWVGLWIVIQAAGDILLEVLRKWPAGVVSGDYATKLLAVALQTVAKRSMNEERTLLLLQAKRALSSGHEAARSHLVLPYLEPLRDLGYLAYEPPRKRGFGYALTEAGRRLQTAFSSTSANADALLRAGLSRAFLLAEGLTQLRPSNPRVLMETLSRLPLELMVSAAEAPLGAMVALAQARLVDKEPGAWIDPEHAHTLLRQVEERSKGRLYLKRGQSIEELNVAWTDPQLFNDTSLWDATMPGEGKNQTHVEAGGGLPLAQTTAGINPDVQVAIQKVITTGTADRVAPAAASDGVIELPWPQLELSTVPTLPLDPAPVQEPLDGAAASSEEDGLLSEHVPGSLRLWLQYSVALLMPPVVGALDLGRWGGPLAALERLQSLLDDLPADRLKEKRRMQQNPVNQDEAYLQTTCVQRFARLQKVFQDSDHQWLFEQVVQRWKDESVNPAIIISRGLRLSNAVHGDLRRLIVSFLASSSQTPDWDQWDMIREATRCLIHDALATGMWSTKVLLERLYGHLAVSKPEQAAVRWLEELTSPRRNFDYDRTEEFEKEVADELHLDTLVEETRKHESLIEVLFVRHEPLSEVSSVRQDFSETDIEHKIRYNFHTTVEARSNYEARMVGRARIHTLLVSRHYQTAAPPNGPSVKLPEKAVSEEAREQGAELNSPEVGSIGYSTPVGLSFAGLYQGARTPRRANWQDLLAASEHGRVKGGPLGAQRRLMRALSGLVQARDPVRSAPERLLLAWSAVEQLLAAGSERKSTVLPALAAAASLVQFRAEFRYIYKDAMAGLVAAVAQRPKDQKLRQLTEIWLPKFAPRLEAALPRTEPSVVARRRMAARRLPQLEDVDEDRALTELWHHRQHIPELKTAIESIAPLAGAGLHKFYRWTGDRKPAPNQIGSGHLLGQYFKELKDEITDFFIHVYEVRNRFAHSGEGFDALREPGTLEMHERFTALIEPVVLALEARVHHLGESLEHAWQLASELAQDLTNLDMKSGLKVERLQNLLDFSPVGRETREVV